jgi:hypothetical protein
MAAKTRIFHPRRPRKPSDIYSKTVVFRLTIRVDALHIPTTERHVDGTPRGAGTSAGYMEVPHHKWWLNLDTPIRSGLWVGRDAEMPCRGERMGFL